MLNFMFRVPDGKHYHYQFNPDDNIEIVKKKICEENNYDIKSIKLIHRSSILEDNTKVKDIKITPIEYIVIQPFSSIPASIDCQIGKLPEISPPKQLSPLEISEALENLKPSQQPHKDQIKVLLEIGFSLQDAIRGLKNTNFNVEMAAEELTNDCYDNEQANDPRRNIRIFRKSQQQNQTGIPPTNYRPPLNLPPGGPLNMPPGGPLNMPMGIPLNNPPPASISPPPGPPLNNQPGSSTNGQPPLNGQAAAPPIIPPANPNSLPLPPPGASLNELTSFLNNLLGPPPPPQDGNPHNQFYEYRSATPEQKRDLDQLAQEYPHLAFDIIIQYYSANEKNLERTKAMLSES